LNLLVGDININTIIVNDGSNNEFISEVEKIKDKIDAIIYLEYQENKGKGYALKHGIEKSTSDFIIFTDVDFPYELESMNLLINELVKGDSDLVIGTRDKTYEKRIPFQRKIISSILKALIKILINIPVADTQAGLKGLKSNAIPVIQEVNIDRYLFDLAFLKLAYKRGLKVSSVPIILRDGIHLPNVSFKVLMKESLNFLKIMIK